MANIGRGLGKFAEGLANGYATGLKNRREQEEHDLRMSRARDDQAMNAEIKKIADMKVAPTAVFVVTGADGNSMTFGDAQAAASAAESTPGAKVAQRVQVGTKQFDDMDDAKDAVEAMNSPMAKTRMAAEIALKYNRPDVHDAHMKAYTMAKEANRADMMETVNAAEIAGKPEMALDAYNKRLPNGMKAEMTPDGTAIQITKKGQPVGAPTPIGSPKEFFDKIKTQIATTPDNYLEVWKHTSGLEVSNKQLGLREREVTSQEKTSAVGVKKTEAEIANIPVENALKARQVGASETSAAASMAGVGVSKARVDLEREQMDMPTVMTGVNEKDEVVVGGTQRMKDPVTKQWGIRALPATVVPGMQPTRMAVPPKEAKKGEFDSMLGAQQAPLTVDWGKIPPKKLGQ